MKNQQKEHLTLRYGADRLKDEISAHHAINLLTLVELGQYDIMTYRYKKEIIIIIIIIIIIVVAGIAQSV